MAASWLSASWMVASCMAASCMADSWMATSWMAYLLLGASQNNCWFIFLKLSKSKKCRLFC